MSLHTAKWDSFAVRESGGANALDAMFRRKARPASGLVTTAELCSAEKSCVSSRDQKFDVLHKI
jgi:hypothetical protein